MLYPYAVENPCLSTYVCGHHQKTVLTQYIYEWWPLDALKKREIVDWCKPKFCCKFWEMVDSWPTFGNLSGWVWQMCGNLSFRSSINAVTNFSPSAMLERVTSLGSSNRKH